MKWKIKKYKSKKNGLLIKQLLLNNKASYKVFKKIMTN